MATKEIEDVKRVLFGSNTFENFTNIFDINNNIPLQIKIADIPLITLSIPLVQNKWVKIVEMNKSNSPEILVEEDEVKNSVLISYGRIVVLNAVKTDEITVEIKEFDLKPLGFEIYLSGGTLFIGTNKFSRNKFIGVNTVFKLG